jgi:hypothetical protein
VVIGSPPDADYWGLAAVTTGAPGPFTPSSKSGASAEHYNKAIETGLVVGFGEC